MNAVTPSIQDFVDRTRLVERRLRTSDTMRCPACGQALPKPTGGYRAAIRCGDHQRSGVTPALPVTITGWYSSAGIVGAWTTSGAVQCGVVPNAAECRAYQRHLTQLQRQEQRRTEYGPRGGGGWSGTNGRLFPHTDDPHLLEQRRRVEPRLHERATKRNHHHRGHGPNPTLPRVRLGDTAASEARQARLLPQVLGANQGSQREPSRLSGAKPERFSRYSPSHAKGAPCASRDTP